MDLHTVVASYNRYFALGDMTGRLDLQLPVQVGRWEGQLDGIPRSERRDGLADPRLRFSVNLAGAPPLEGEDFRQYLKIQDEGRTIVGAALAVRVPLGEYSEDKLINLGENRFGFQPQLGVVHVEGPWSFELTGSVFLHTRNGDFFNGSTLDQDPTYAIQAHVVRTFGPDLRVSAGGLRLGRRVDPRRRGQGQRAEGSSLRFHRGGLGPRPALPSSGLHPPGRAPERGRGRPHGSAGLGDAVLKKGCGPGLSSLRPAGADVRRGRHEGGPGEPTPRRF